MIVYNEKINDESNIEQDQYNLKNIIDEFLSKIAQYGVDVSLFDKNTNKFVKDISKIKNLNNLILIQNENKKNIKNENIKANFLKSKLNLKSISTNYLYAAERSESILSVLKEFTNEISADMNKVKDLEEKMKKEIKKINAQKITAATVASIFSIAGAILLFVPGVNAISTPIAALVSYVGTVGSIESDGGLTIAKKQLLEISSDILILSDCLDIVAKEGGSLYDMIESNRYQDLSYLNKNYDYMSKIIHVIDSLKKIQKIFAKYSIPYNDYRMGALIQYLSNAKDNANLILRDYDGY
ncbi:hypothetical protein [Mycoplasmopsis adleri]|uniref:hypothetical protein n=1 Tax=Mycoplasmopsis adleri TaxID=51362 RepID=UPI0038738D20